MHIEIEKLRKENDFVFALAGNPNVGKSTIFSSLTSEYVEVANYPGKTVGLNIASAEIGSTKIGFVDLPGTYSLGAITDDQWVARRALLDYKFDAVIYILDSTNISRNLYMLLQLIDMGLPVVAALNLSDEALKKGIYIDKNKLSHILGIEITETVAIKSFGLEKLINSAITVAKNYKDGGFVPRKIKYSADIENFIDEIFKILELNLKKTSCDIKSFPLSNFAKSILLFEKDAEFVEEIKKCPSIYEKISQIWQKIYNKYNQGSDLILAGERNNLAEDIVEECQVISIQYRHKETKLFNFITHPFWGMVTLLFVIVSMFFILYYSGTFLSVVIEKFWNNFISHPLDNLIFLLSGPVLGKILVFALDGGILAVLTIGIPYIFIFYLMLALLEDTGYLNIVAFLVDKIMHKLGLHGRASIMLIAAMGCNVPAIMGVKTLSTKREKFLASLLITLIPCGARTGVIMGAVSLFLGPLWAMSIFVIAFLITFVSGYFLNKILKGSPRGLVMEIADLRLPTFKVIMYKTWHRFKDFVFVATPIILIGSAVLGYLYEGGLIWHFEKPLKFVVEDLLGLPAVAGLTLVFALLRKELALIFLVTLAMQQFGEGAKSSLLNFMTKQQIYVYVLVNTIYIPCLATIGVLAREVGIKRTIYITILTTSIAILVGILARLIISYFHLL